MGRFVFVEVQNDTNGIIAGVNLVGMAQATYYARIVGTWTIQIYGDAEMSMVAGQATITGDGEITMDGGQTLSGTLTIDNIATIEADNDIVMVFRWKDTGAVPGSMGGGMASPGESPGVM
jgi:hypothetical protein